MLYPVTVPLAAVQERSISLVETSVAVRLLGVPGVAVDDGVALASFESGLAPLLLIALTT